MDTKLNMEDVVAKTPSSNWPNPRPMTWNEGQVGLTSCNELNANRKNIVIHTARVRMRAHRTLTNARSDMGGSADGGSCRYQRLGKTVAAGTTAEIANSADTSSPHPNWCASNRKVAPRLPRTPAADRTVKARACSRLGNWDRKIKIQHTSQFSKAGIIS